MHNFEYLQPLTREQALTQINQHADSAKILGGGTALMLAMRQRMLAPSHLIDVVRVAGMNSIAESVDGGLQIGGAVRHQAVARSPLVQQQCPVLARVAGELANPQVRAQGTLAGNLCYGDPTTDPPGLLLALGASVHLASLENGQVQQRSMSIEDFLVDYFETAIAPNEVLTQITVPKTASNQVVLYERFRKTAAEHRPLINISIVAQQQGLELKDVRIVVGATVPVARRLPTTEKLLESQSLSESLIVEVATQGAAEITSVDDARGSEQYRRHIVCVIMKRMLMSLNSRTMK